MLQEIAELLTDNKFIVGLEASSVFVAPCYAFVWCGIHGVFPFFLLIYACDLHHE